MREKRQLPSSRFDLSDDSSWEDDFSLYSEGDRGWNGPLDYDQSQEMTSGQRSISPPLTQRELADLLIQEDPGTPNSKRDQSREGTDLETTSHGKPTDYTRMHQGQSSRFVGELKSLTNISATQDALRRPETSTVPNPLPQTINHQRENSKASSPPNPFQRSINHPRDSMNNTTPKTLASSILKSPGSGQRPLLDFWGSEKRNNPFEAPKKRLWDTIGHVVEQGGLKKPRRDPTPIETSLPRDMRLNTILSVSLNGDKPGRERQKCLGDCKSMKALFAEIARGWRSEGVDEEDCYIEVTYNWKPETDEGRIAYLERYHESGLKDLYNEIKENQCWNYEANARCIINMKICQKY